ncbi:reverse transcriptase domain-containing protein [Tanacetum coccineum]|uniref:Reverse transcriptase domain-containing protein n=1 Tax=Tanacetum coccineum TaxID=301880 RepID=A0ABQ4WBH3_9ASTR
MHTRGSNSKLVEPLSEHERTLNQRLRRQNRRVPYDQRNNLPQHPRIVYPLILNINYFCHFLDILRNYDPMDDEPMWVADRVVALTPGSAITIPKTANEFAIKGNHLTLVKGNQFDGRTKTDPHKHIHEFLRICDVFKYKDTKNEAVCLMMFPLSLTGEAKTWLDELNEGAIETWDELRTAFISQFFPSALFDLLLREICAFSQHENESLTDAWLRMKEMLRNCHGHNLSKGNIIKIFYHGLNEITQEVLNAAAGGIFLYKTPNQAYQLLEDKVLLKLDWAKNQKTKSSLKKTVAFADEGNSNSDTDKIMARMDAMTIKMDAQYKELQSRAKQPTPDLDDDDIPMSREEEAKFMQTFCKTRFYNDYRDRDSNRDNWRSSGWNDYNRDNYQSNTDHKSYELQSQFNDFMKSQQSTNAFFDKLADKQSGQPFRSLPSKTQPNPRGNNSKAYQPPQSRNEHVNVVFARSGKSCEPSDNPNDQQKNSENPINFDNDDEDEEPTPQPKNQLPKPVKETPLPKPYKPKILYPQRLRKEKMEAQYGKFLDMILAVRINVPLVDVLAEMPNYGKFLKELISNKHKIEKISVAFLRDESFTILQNKVPPKLGDPGSFLIPCNFNKTFSCNALADLGASINLMPYSLYAKLSLETLKPTKMSVRLADRSFQYPVGIAENMLVEVGKFTFPANFVILEMEEDSKKQLNLGVGTERMIFNIDSAIKHSYLNDDTCFSIDVIDEILDEDFDALLDEGSKILHSVEGTVLEEEIFSEFDKFIAMTADEIYDSEFDTEEPPFEKITINTDYKIKTSLEEPPTDLELKPLPDNLEYVFLEEPSFLPVIISSQLSAQNKSKLVFVLKNIKKHLPGKQQIFLVSVRHSANIRYNFWMTRNQLSKNREVLGRMPFGYAPATFQRCMLAIFHDMIEEFVEVFMDDFSVFGNSFDKYLNNLDKMLQRCKDAHLVLNWEKCHFMVKEGIVLGHKVSSTGLEVDKAEIDVISKLPPSTNIKGVRSFL